MTIYAPQDGSTMKPREVQQVQCATANGPAKVVRHLLDHKVLMPCAQPYVMLVTSSFVEGPNCQI